MREIAVLAGIGVLLGIATIVTITKPAPEVRVVEKAVKPEIIEKSVPYPIYIDKPVPYPVYVPQIIEKGQEKPAEKPSEQSAAKADEVKTQAQKLQANTKNRSNSGSTKKSDCSRRWDPYRYHDDSQAYNSHGYHYGSHGYNPYGYHYGQYDNYNHY